MNFPEHLTYDSAIIDIAATLEIVGDLDLIDTCMGSVVDEFALFKHKFSQALAKQDMTALEFESEKLYGLTLYYIAPQLGLKAEALFYSILDGIDNKHEWEKMYHEVALAIDEVVNAYGEKKTH